MLDQVLEVFDIKADRDLNIMRQNQTLPELTARLMIALDDAFACENPDVVLGQGDTTSVMVAALAAFYRGIPFGHVESGLRTGNLAYPFPEEMNRVLRVTSHAGILLLRSQQEPTCWPRVSMRLELRSPATRSLMP
jgi:UDP-N-acetylglucosamine 2-epimerase (non-hydrolysing)